MASSLKEIKNKHNEIVFFCQMKHVKEEETKFDAKYNG